MDLPIPSCTCIFKIILIFSPNQIKLLIRDVEVSYKVERRFRLHQQLNQFKYGNTAYEGRGLVNVSMEINILDEFISFWTRFFMVRLLP